MPRSAPPDALRAAPTKAVGESDGGLLNWIEDALDNLCNTPTLGEAGGAGGVAGGDNSPPSTARAGGAAGGTTFEQDLGEGAKACMQAVTQAGAVCKRATQKAVGQVMDAIDRTTKDDDADSGGRPRHALREIPQSDASLEALSDAQELYASLLQHWYHDVWAECGGSTALTAASAVSAECVAGHSPGDAPAVLQVAMQEIPRQLTPLPRVACPAALGDVELDMQHHPLREPLLVAVAEVQAAADVPGVPTLRSVRDLTRVALGVLASVTAEGCRDAAACAVQVGGHTPLRQLDVRGLSYRAGEGVVQASKSVSQLRSQHRQAAMYLAFTSLCLLKTAERRTLMNMTDDSDSDTLLEIREAVGSGSKLVGDAVDISLAKIEAIYAHAVAPLQMRLVCHKSVVGSTVLGKPPLSSHVTV